MFIKTAVIAATAALTAAGTLSAQATDSQPSRWALTLPSGSFVPTGTMRETVKRGNLSAVQLSFAANPIVAVTSTFGWARSRDIATADDPKLDVFTYDIGAELRAPRLKSGGGVSFMPFAGLGAGGRSYNHRSLDIAATHAVVAYGGIGGDLTYRRVGLRIEARDYVSDFKPLTGTGASRTGNDVVVMAGLRLIAR